MSVASETIDLEASAVSLRNRLAPALQQTLQSLNYAHFTPIQLAALPPMLDGLDVRAQAKTGSGKTAAFGLALLSRLSLERIAVQGLVLCPTRELADQVAAELRRLGSAMPNLKISTIYGGVAIGPQQTSLTKHSPHIIVGTPGRVLDHFDKGHLNFDSVQTLVLDEADRLLDMGFEDSMSTLIASMPKVRQTLLLSATFPSAVDLLSSQVQQDALHVAVDVAHTEEVIEQHFYSVPESGKAAAVVQILLSRQPESTLIFCNTKRDLHELVEYLHAARIPALALHGDLEQRDRTEVLVRFSNGSARVLVATDVAARGLDMKTLALVISYELAFEAQTHTHRIGRTGRAGETGVALHLVADRELERAQRLNAQLEPLRIMAGSKALMPAAMQTLVIDAGKTDKIRAGDVLGALTGAGSLSGELIGKIELTPTRTYVAIASAEIDGVIKRMRGATSTKASATTAKIKGRNFRLRLL